MKQYEVFFYHLTEAQTKEINQKGWNSPLGLAYTDFTFGRGTPRFDGAVQHDMYEHATTISVDDLEHTYTLLQNHSTPWSVTYPAHTKFPRSMSVGDVIWHRDTDTFLWCAAEGFMEIHNARFTDYLKQKVAVSV